MPELNPAAALIQQNKQAELGRREDRAQSQQQMLATLLTLFQQGKLSREQLEAQMAISRERVAADRDINAAHMQTQKDIAHERVMAEQGIAEKNYKLAADQASFQRMMVTMLTQDRLMEKFNTADPEETEADYTMKSLEADEVERQARAKAIMDGTKAGKVGEQYAEEKAAHLKTGQEETKTAIGLSLAAGPVGTHVAKQLAIGGAPVASATDLIAPMQASGAFGSGGSTKQFSSLMSSVAEVTASPDKPPPAALRNIYTVLHGDGKNPGIGPEATFSFVETLRQMEADLRAHTDEGISQVMNGNGPVPTGASVVNAAQTSAQKADAIRDIIGVIESQDPHGANLLRSRKTYSDAMKRYTSNLKPGQLINNEEVWKDIGTVFTGGDPKKLDEVSQAIAATAPSFGGNPSVDYWKNRLAAGRADWLAFKESPDADARKQDAFHTAALQTMKMARDQKRNLALYNRWFAAEQNFGNLQASSFIQNLPPDQAKQWLDNARRPVDALARQMAQYGLSTDGPPLMKSLEELEMIRQDSATKKAAALEQDAQKQFMMQQKAMMDDQLRQRSMAPAGPVNPAIAAGMQPPVKRVTQPAQPGSVQGAPIDAPAIEQPVVAPTAKPPQPVPWGYDPLTYQPGAGG